MAHPLDKFIPKTPIFNALRKKMPFGFGVGDDAENLYPKGVRTPFWIYSEMGNESELFPIVGNAEFSLDLAHWFNPTNGNIPISAGHQVFIRWKGAGEKVKLGVIPFSFSIGGNLFSLTRKEWDENTRTQEANGIGEFESAFLNQKNLIHAKHVLLSAYTDKRAYNQLFKGCVNLEDIPKIIAEECQSATYSSFLSGCAKVTEIYCNITQWQQYTDFTLGLPAVGKFYKRESASIPHGKDGVPVGWEVVTLDINHLGNATPFWIKNLSLTEVNNFSLEGTYQYSWDALNWVDMSAPTGTLQPQQSVFLRTKPSSGSKVKITASTQLFEIGGNLFSLTRDEWDESTKTNSDEFKRAFANLQNLISVEYLLLPKHTGVSGLDACFDGCSNLDKICNIEIKSINSLGFNATFRATSLENEVVNMIISDSASASNAFMFQYSKIKELNLNITRRLTTSSYIARIVSTCKQIEKVVCNAISLRSQVGMMEDCPKLNYIDIRYCTEFSGNNDWVKGVAERGTIVIQKGMRDKIPLGTSGIPRGWKVVEVEPPAENQPIAN